MKRILIVVVILAAGAAGVALVYPRLQSTPRTVKAVMQARPGGPMEEIEAEIHPAPVDLPSVPAAEAGLQDDDLVLGVVLEGQAMAFPVRYLALHEVLDHRVGTTPIAPTW